MSADLIEFRIPPKPAPPEAAGAGIATEPLEARSVQEARLITELYDARIRLIAAEFAIERLEQRVAELDARK